MVNTNCQEEEEKVELEMTGLANFADVTVNENSFQTQKPTFILYVISSLATPSTGD